MSEQRVILLEPFSESKAGIEHEMIALDAGEGGGLCPLAKISLHEQNRIANRRKRVPLFGSAARVHEHSSNFQLGQRLGHLWIPPKSADIVDDLGALVDRGPRDARFVGIDADDRLRTTLLQVADHRQNALAFLFLG